MTIDLSELFGDYDGSLEISGKCDFSKTDFLGDTFVFPDGLYVEGKITKTMKTLNLTAKVSGNAVVPCSRCLKDVIVPVAFDIAEIMMREGEEISDDEDIVVISGHTLEIDDIVLNNFLMNVSGKYLCREDCKGLCPKCGKDLNEGSCNCINDEPDPRWSALTEIMNNSQ